MRSPRTFLGILVCAVSVAVVLPARAAVPGEITLEPNIDVNPPEAGGLSASPAGIVYRTRSPDGLTDTWNILAADSSTPVALDPGGPIPSSTVGGVVTALIVGDEVAVPIALSPTDYELASVRFFGLDGELVGSVSMGADELWLGSTGTGAIVLERFPDTSRKLVVRTPGAPEDVLLDLSWGDPRGLITDTTGGFFVWLDYVVGFETYKLAFPVGTATTFNTSPDSQPGLSGLDPTDVMWRTGLNTLVVEPRAGGEQARMTVGNADCISCIEGSALSGSTVAWIRTVACGPGPCTYALKLRPADGTGSDTDAGLTLTQTTVERAPGGGFIVVGQPPGTEDTAILHVSEDGSEVSLLQTLEPQWESVSGLQVSAGRVAIGDHSSDWGAVSSVRITNVGGDLTTHPERTLASDLGGGGLYGPPVLASGDRTAYVSAAPRNAVILRGGQVERVLPLGSNSAIERLSGNHLQYFAQNTQHVLNTFTGRVVDVPDTALLWGHWVAYLQVVQTNEGADCHFVKLNVDAPTGTPPAALTGTLPSCNFNVLDWWGPWLALDVGPNGEVLNTETEQSFSIPWTSHVDLGDGTLLAPENVDRYTDHLVVMDLTDPAHPQSPIASITSSPSENPYGLDQRGGQLVTWLGLDRLVHVAPTGIPASAPTELDRVVRDRFSPNHDGSDDVWRPMFDITKGVTWSLTLRNSDGRAVRHLSGTGPLGSVDPVWRGRSDRGRRLPDGTYSWALSMQGADGIGELAFTGSVRIKA